MQTKHLCVLIHIRTKGEVGIVKHGLSPPVKIFFSDRSNAMFLLWIIFVIYVSCFSCFLVCSLQLCGHPLGKGLPLRPVHLAEKDP